MNVRRQLIVLGVALANGLGSAPLLAQEQYPTKGIKIILAWPAGLSPQPVKAIGRCVVES